MLHAWSSPVPPFAPDPTPESLSAYDAVQCAPMRTAGVELVSTHP